MRVAVFLLVLLSDAQIRKAKPRVRTYKLKSSHPVSGPAKIPHKRAAAPKPFDIMGYSKEVSALTCSTLANAFDARKY